MNINYLASLVNTALDWIRSPFSKDGIASLLLPKDFDFKFENSQDVTNCFIFLIWGTIIFSILFIVIRYSWRYFRINQALLKDITTLSNEGTSPESCPIDHELFRKYYNGLIWRGKKVYSTIPVDEVFSYETLAPNISNSQHISFVVTLLTGLGVLGTFLGLTIGLNGLTFVGSSAVIAKQIQTMTGCATTAFVTSVWGVGSGLALNVLRYFIWAFLLRPQINKIRKKLEETYPLTSPVDNFMVSVEENLTNSNDTLSKLAEEIGKRMQTSTEDLAQNIESALNNTSNHLDVLIDKITQVIPDRICDGLSQAMEPAVNQLVQASADMNNRSFNSSQGALEALVERFINEVGKAGNEQRDGIEAATTSLKDALQENATKTKELFEMIISQQQKQSEELNAQSVGMVSKVENMLSGFIERMNGEISESNTKQREDLSSIIVKLQESLQASTEQSTKVFEKLSEQQTNHVETVKEQESKVLAEIASMMASHQKSIDSFEDIINKNSNSSNEIVGQTRVVQEGMTNNVRSLRDINKSFENLSAKLDSSAQSLNQLGKNIDKTLKDVSSSINKALASATSLNDGSKAIQTSFTNATTKLELVKDSLASTSSSFLQTAKSIDARNETMNANFKDMMLDYNKKVAEMMTSYTDKVQDQTSTRLKKWDDETRQFCNSMTQVVEVIGDLVDNIESKRR